MLFSLDTPATNDVDKSKIYDFLILGGGPAGLNAAIYATRKGLTTVMVAKDIGGQLKNTNDVENYLGFQRIDAKELIDLFKKHAASLDIPIVSGQKVVSFTKEGDLFLSKLENGEVIKSRTALIALGGTPRQLHVKGEDEYYGRGLTYCAICDGPFYKEKVIAVAGGGNSGVEAAIDLSKITKKVILINRGDKLTADRTLTEKLETIKNVEVENDLSIEEVRGQKALNEVIAKNNLTGKDVSFKVDALFVEIGNVPNSKLFEGLVALNERKEIITDQLQHTSVEGLYAAGDITNQPYRQIIIAAAEGAKAALEANNLLMKKGE
jgi:thioredoxin-disulfide reductase